MLSWPRVFHHGDLLAYSRKMKERTLTLPEIGLIAGTRVALGLGIGFLLSDRLSRDKRKGAGWALLAIGVATTIPMVLQVIGKRPSGESPIALVS
jgi:hypothetical protein